jgi:hypothetical protein
MTWLLGLLLVIMDCSSEEISKVRTETETSEQCGGAMVASSDVLRLCLDGSPLF